MFFLFTAPTVDGNSARRDFLSYALSLMRSHHDEHSDSLPIMDITALKHMAYVFDALIYYMRTAPDSDVEALRDGMSVSSSWQDGDDGEEEHEDELAGGSSSNVSAGGANSSALNNMDSESTDGESDSATRLGRRHPFFQRSDSTIFMGCPPPDPFHTPLVEALPLADQPHLLQPNARREDYFGMAKPTVVSKNGEGTATTSSVTLAQQLPLSLALSTNPEDERSQLARGLRNAAFQPISAAPLGSSVGAGSTIMSASLSGSSRVATGIAPSTAVTVLPASGTGSNAGPRSSTVTSAEHLLRVSQSDLFPQSVAVNLSLSAASSNIAAGNLVQEHHGLMVENPANIPLPSDVSTGSSSSGSGGSVRLFADTHPHALAAHAHMPPLSSHSPQRSQGVPELGPSTSVGVLGVGLPAGPSSSSAFLISHQPLTSVSVAAPSSPSTPNQLSRAILSAFSEIATGRERLSTSSVTNTTTAAATIASSSSPRNQAAILTPTTPLLPVSVPAYQQIHIQQQQQQQSMAVVDGSNRLNLSSPQMSVIMHTASSSSTPPTHAVSVASPVIIQASQVQGQSPSQIRTPNTIVVSTSSRLVSQSTPSALMPHPSSSAGPSALGLASSSRSGTSIQGQATHTTHTTQPSVEDGSQPAVLPKLHFAFLAWNQQAASSSSASGASGSSVGSSAASTLTASQGEFD